MSQTHALSEFSKFAEQLAQASGDIIRRAAREPVAIEVKSDASPVTAVDKAVEDRLRDMIGETYPDHGILGEERGATSLGAEFNWVLDPIDGTLPFLAGIPVYGTLIALVHGEIPVLGVIDMPMTAERWMGVAGRATTRNGDPVRTRRCATLGAALMSTSNPDFYNTRERPAFARLHGATKFCVYGGSCMAYGRIADGRTDIGIDVGYDIYDYLALVPVIAGAGGRITDWEGAPLGLNSGSRLLAAGDERMHGRPLKLLNLD